MKIATTLAAALSLATVASTAQANINSDYIGGKIGSYFDGFGDVVTMSAYAGTSISGGRGLEGELYTDFGNDISSFGASISGIYRHQPINLPFYVKGKLGVTYYGVEQEINGINFLDSKGGFDAVYGLGMGGFSLGENLSLQADITELPLGTTFTLGLQMDLQ